MANIKPYKKRFKPFKNPEMVPENIKNVSQKAKYSRFRILFLWSTNLGVYTLDIIIGNRNINKLMKKCFELSHVSPKYTKKYFIIARA